MVGRERFICRCFVRLGQIYFASFMKHELFSRRQNANVVIIERTCNHHIKYGWNDENRIFKSGKYCGKRRRCCLAAFVLFAIFFLLQSPSSIVRRKSVFFGKRHYSSLLQTILLKNRNCSTQWFKHGCTWIVLLIYPMIININEG